MILEKREDIEFIESNFLNDKEYSVIYRGSIDGFRAKDFHENCDEMRANFMKFASKSQILKEF